MREGWREAETRESREKEERQKKAGRKDREKTGLRTQRDRICSFTDYNSFIQSFILFLLSTYSVPGTVRGAGIQHRTKQRKILPGELTFYKRKTENE